MKTEKKRIRTKKGLRQYSHLGCPLTRNRSAWCFRICQPDAEGHGHCGRVAPHSFKSRTQLAIQRHRKKLQAHFEKLERFYLASPHNEYYEAGIRVSQGEADIVIPIRDKLSQVAVTLLDSICFKAMNDSALFAVNSLVANHLVMTVNFNISLTGTIPTGDLIARGRYVGMSGSHYLAESMLTDSKQREIGRADGAFMESTFSLPCD